jgi:hypothetical protein
VVCKKRKASKFHDATRKSVKERDLLGHMGIYGRIILK